MSLSELRDALPAYAADLKADLLRCEDDTALSSEERWGCFVACAVASAQPDLLRQVTDGAGEALGGRGMEAAKSAAAITSMNDVFYGAVGMLKNPEYANLPSGLVMDALGRPGVEKTTFDLWCLAVSAFDGCAPLMDAQDDELRSRGVPAARVLAALRVAAVTAAVARVLACEAALSKDDGGDGETPPDDDDQEDAMPDPQAGSRTDPQAEGEAPAKTPHPAGTAEPGVTGAPHPAPSPGEGVTPG